MIKPEFLPFNSIDFTKEQALQAGMYVLSLDYESPVGGKVDVYQELTGTHRSVGDDLGRMQETIVSRVTRVLNLYIGVGNRVVPNCVIGRFNSDIEVSLR